MSQPGIGRDGIIITQVYSVTIDLALAWAAGRFQMAFLWVVHISPPGVWETYQNEKQVKKEHNNIFLLHIWIHNKRHKNKPELDKRRNGCLNITNVWLSKEKSYRVYFIIFPVIETKVRRWPRKSSACQVDFRKLDNSYLNISNQIRAIAKRYHMCPIRTFLPLNNIYWKLSMY